jgi:HKD family nuclease
MLIPSEDLPDARSALAASIVSGSQITAAVAFVTQSGVRLLGDLLDSAPGTTLQLTARAEGVTDPEALLALRDDLGADVWVVIGRRARAFHPKLWLIEDADGMSVLSGSGNLTEGE